MARRAFLPTNPPPPPPTAPGAAPTSSRASIPPPPPTGSIPPSSRTSIPPPPQGPRSQPPSSMSPESRLSLPPLSEGISVVQVSALLDRLSAADETAFLVQWIEQLQAGRPRLDPALSVRLLRGYREVGRIDRARDLAASLPSAPAAWNPLDAGRLAIERAALATIDGRADHAEAELRLASRALGAAPRGTGLREQLDLHLTTAQLELRQHRVTQAASALRLAEHVSERLEDGAWRVPVSMTLGHLAMRLADPRAATKHYANALTRSPSRGQAALRAHGNLAIALGSTGRFDDARVSAQTACAIAGEIASGWRHADAFDVLAIVEIAADRPLAALEALDSALGALGELEQPTLRYQLAGHRTWVLAMLGRAQAAKQWLAKADKFRAEIGVADAIDDQDLVATRARTFESCNQPDEALRVALPHVTELPDAFVTGSLNLVVARCAIAVGDTDTGRNAIERVALSGDKHGWVFPERSQSAALWDLALKSGDSRVVRYAEKMLAYISGSAPPPSLPPPRNTQPSVAPPSMHPPGAADAEDSALENFGDGEVLIYVTTLQGVSRVRLSDLSTATAGAALVVDTISHCLKIFDREVSLERRRALEPLVVQLLRRAREGLSADEILRAAGGPGPESADAEHRVRVLISRVRDLLGDPAAIERVRDAGEHGKTRYRLSPNVRFALVEPLANN